MHGLGWGTCSDCGTCTWAKPWPEQSKLRSSSLLRTDGKTEAVEGMKERPLRHALRRPWPIPSNKHCRELNHFSAASTRVCRELDWTAPCCLSLGLLARQDTGFVGSAVCSASSLVACKHHRERSCAQVPLLRQTLSALPRERSPAPLLQGQQGEQGLSTHTHQPHTPTRCLMT
jgi:hypothetical protein